MLSFSMSKFLKAWKTVTVSGTETSFTLYDKTTPKLAPPPPRIAQKTVFPHFSVEDIPFRIDDLRVNNLVTSQAVLPQHVPVPAAADVSAGADRRTDSVWKTKKIGFGANYGGRNVGIARRGDNEERLFGGGSV
ncbi:LOW QUALITY PROTEIN: hypothetical protein PanWU01x14_307150 [Parasponia andersonii]|uniref:Uncharacterized protein n=1 Tax=Parasponia andersonii TaxID=3476 RepID=A0A2P5ARI4_PARAD|nr:LOW QUALITY PROTEIN: hypothetical protein PanWU01x14_307150 [Parasponia andersonii]